MSRSSGNRRILLIAAVLLSAGYSVARAGDDPVVNRGVEYLRRRAGSMGAGESALAALAMIKADVPVNDPAVLKCFEKIRSRFTSHGYNPEQPGGHDIYEAGVVAMALANLETEARRAELDVIARYLIGLQKANGSWDYVGRTAGDTSISQYAILGLWEAENAGSRVPGGVWDRAAAWYISTQLPSGAWRYHHDEAGGLETVSMTAAGVGSLLICKRQLSRHRRAGDQPSSLLIALKPEGPDAPYEATTSFSRIDQACSRGMSWLAANFTAASSPTFGPSTYYGLYGIERIGALADRATLGRVDWYEQGRRFIQSSQGADGSWNSAHGIDPNTVWAILFLAKSTAKTLRRIEIKRLGAGTLLGGRGLPRDLSSMTVAAGRVVSRPMNGAVEGMLAVLEDPRAQIADSALAGLVTRYETDGPRVLRPHKDRFRKMLKNHDPGLRRVAAWALGRTGDLDAVPALIDAVTDPDDEVVETARLGLQLLSRKIVGPGPYLPSTPEQRKDAAAKWRAWYETIRPLELEGQGDGDESSSAANRSGTNPPKGPQ